MLIMQETRDSRAKKEEVRIIVDAESCKPLISGYK
jgi:hypothetical protein